ncbi:MAG: enoyl-CoA hydratase/isomerase family protein [Candidatus Acididesulfobacter diazotrophicus]|jgi:enoyl-CoA hydratase/carnithine racemase|uniref:Enoyl-CoA hydratase/isomerase family protein n=1 Tax=Candidatus Acididesulfobacter diazotrophicus TaxID=2597226 RepID=A0A519BM54_9DELT|nr:MAG: enoyl-CoA hydratase/isomerase family protein [Candidatus Acididesulfobacter diazotrophicus]
MAVNFEVNKNNIGIIDLNFGNKNELYIQEINEIIKVIIEQVLQQYNIRAVLIKSSNPEYFAVGPAIKKIKDLDKNDARYFATVLNKMINHIENIEIPVIAKIEGIVSGIGFDIAAACDFKFATLDATFADYSVRCGIVSPSALISKLIFLIGAQKAKEIVLSGRKFSAKEMYSFNFLTKVLNKEDEDIDNYIDKFLNDFNESSIQSLKITKKFFNEMMQNQINNSPFSLVDIFSEFFHSDQSLKSHFESIINLDL